MIDKQGFRANVGIIVMNDRGQLLWARRCGGQNAWQFPQGGLAENETPRDAMFRELKEELGLNPHDVEVIAETQHWLRYRLPKRFQRHEPTDNTIHCIGQKQKWFLLKLISTDSAIQLDDTDHPEFDTWRWVHYWLPLKQVIFFKKHVYRRALEEFKQHVNKDKK